MRKYMHVLLLLVGMMTLAAPVHAERRDPLRDQPAVRRRLQLRKLRLEITPQFLTSINQDYKHAFGPALNIQFHILDWLAVGVEGGYMFNANTALEDKVRSVLTDGPYSKGPRPTLGMHDERVLGIDALGSAYVQITPFYGKIAFFSALFVNYDLYVNGGVGLVHYVQKNCCKNVDTKNEPAIGDPNLEDPSRFAGLKVGGQFTVGAHLYFNEWFGLQFELRDYITKANPGGNDVDGDRHLTSADEGAQNNLFFGVGFTFMLPPGARQTR